MLPLGRALAFLVAWPGLHPEWTFARDPAADRRRGLRALAIGLLETGAALAWAVVADRAGILDGPLYPASWARVASLVLGIDGAFRAAGGALEAAGLRHEEVFRDPWLLEDLRSFWGRRWNRIVGRTLALEVYAPARRAAGVPAGVLAAFLASGVLHEVIFYLSSGRSAGAYLAFFGLHGVAVLALGAALPAAGRTAAGRAARRAAGWAVLLATAPLFTGDAYRLALPLEDLFP